MEDRDELINFRGEGRVGFRRSPEFETFEFGGVVFVGREGQIRNSTSTMSKGPRVGSGWGPDLETECQGFRHGGMQTKGCGLQEPERTTQASGWVGR